MTKWELVQLLQRMKICYLCFIIFGIMTGIVGGVILLMEPELQTISEPQPVFFGALFASLMASVIPFIVYCFGLNKIKQEFSKEEMEDMDLPNFRKYFVVGVSLLAVFFVGMAICAFIVKLATGSLDDDFSDVFEKDPNSWTDEEQDYVNDFFEWMGNN